LVREDLPSLLPTKELFKGLRADLVERIVQASTLIELKPNEYLEKPTFEDAAEHHYYVLRGKIGVVRPRRVESFAALPPKSHLPNPGREYVLFLTENDFFSDGFFQISAFTGDPRSIRCVGIMHSTLLVVPVALTHDLMSKAPGWASKLKERNTELRRYYHQHHRGDLRVVQDFFLQHNYAYATTLKVIDLDRCIGCDGCERACADRHGVARLQRKGPVLGRLAFPVSCRTCEDHRCLPACGFDAISLGAHEEVKINNMKCVGCAACYSACPNDVISMIEVPYTAENFPEQLPYTDPDGRTNVPDLYLVGEATGTALIKLAINAGRKAVEVAAEKFGSDKGGDRAVKDVIIVGAGPAGLSASLTAKEFGLDFLVFDKGDFSTTIKSYPRHKVVMAEPMHIPLYGKLWLKDTTKEELIQQWSDIITKTGLQIRSNEQVTDVQRATDGVFDVTTAKGKFRSRAVVLATGTRGSPRKIECPGEEEPRVQYALTEPAEFRGKHCLVIGGGDSAVEGAMSLADIPGTTVTLSYRKDSFGRIKPRNKTRIDEYAASGKVTVIFESSVKAVEPGKVTLKAKQGPVTLRNDQVFAMLGGEPPTKFFEKVGIQIIQPKTPEMDAFAKSRGNRRFASKCDHCSDHSDQACISACPTSAIIEIKPSDVFTAAAEAEGHKVPFALRPFEDGIPKLLASSGVRWIAAVTAVLSMLGATIVGMECFLRRLMPEWSMLHYWQVQQGLPVDVTFTSGAGLGFVLGIIGTALMAMTALYPLHSRLGFLRGIAKTRFWLAGHILAGILGPVFVTYHTTLKLNRWPSVAFWLTWLVVLTGALGRSVYTSIRKAHGLTDFEGRSAEAERKKLVDELGARKGNTQVIKILDLVPKGEKEHVSPIGATFRLIGREITLFFKKVWLRYVKLRNVADLAARDKALDVLTERTRKEVRAQLLESVVSSMSVWRKLHLIATLIMFAVAIAHIVAAMLFKVT
jgi:putative YpdA family bacillithiol system oxidoreductase